MSTTAKPKPSQVETLPAARGRARSRGLLAALVALILACGGWVLADWWTCLPEDTQATYVGRQSCVQCHQAQTRQWEGSHHDLAMDRASEETVLGDFDDAQLTHFGITSRMYRQDGKFMIHTEGPDGKLADFEIKYVLGVDPLQQYMVEFDRTADMPDSEIARLQVLRVSWDTHQGKWFYLPPPDVDEKLSPDDDLHWTGVAQRWNNMCADCHSTNLQKNFDDKTLTYHTTFSEIDVSCETCHGPGSVHVQLANRRSLFWDRKLGYGLARLKDKNTEVEIHSCAPCHSRRRLVHPNYRPDRPFHDHFNIELLDWNTYHADGQILDEVYVYGSFIQSKMHHKDIRCTDCHDPHTARLKHEGNQVCTSCHQHSAGKYDSPSHHHHEPGSTGASCVACHMPETTYMEVDPRRDHSLRIPRPDLSVRLGTPNACTGCHLEPERISPDKRAGLRQYLDWLLAARPLEGEPDEEILQELQRVDQWVADYTEQWYAPQREGKLPTHFAEALAAVRAGREDAESHLHDLLRRKDVPVIARATAVSELGRFSSRASQKLSEQALGHEHPLVRAAAITSLENRIPSRTEVEGVHPAQLSALADQLQEVVDPLLARLHDASRLVRIEAARVLCRVPPELVGVLTTGSQRRALDAALEELKVSLTLNNDRGGAHAVLGSVYENLGEDKKAEAAYRKAIRVEPGLVGPRTNLAALMDRYAADAERDAQRAMRQGDRDAAQRAMQQIGQYRQTAATLRQEELPLLARDARLAPYNAAIQYRYGLSLYLNDRSDEAAEALLKAHRLEPDTAQYLLMLALLYQKMEKYDEALHYAEVLVQRQSDNASYQQLLNEIRQQAQSQ